MMTRVGAVSYLLALPSTLSSAHDVFHFSMLRKYIPNALHKNDFSEVVIREYMSYNKKP